MYELEQHKFCKKVLENLKPIMEKVKDIEWIEDSKGDKFFIPKNPLKPNSEQTYTLNVFNYMSNLLGLIRKMQSIEIYIGRFPSPRTYEKKGITEDKWIKYHYSVYNAMMVAIFDTTLILVSEVFILGLDPKDCNERTVLENSKIRYTTTGKAILELDQITKKYRQPRNLYFHKGYDPEIGILQILEGLSLMQMEGLSMMDVNKLDELYKLTRQVILDELTNQTKIVIEIISSLFEAIFSQYDLQFQIKQFVTKT